MFSFKKSTILQLIILSTFISLITLSPSINIIPKDLLRTSFHDSQRLLELLTLGLVLLQSIFSKQRDSNFSANMLVQYALYALIVLAIISSYLAISPRHALIEICTFGGLSYLSLFWANLYANHENKPLMIKQLSYIFWASLLLYMTSFYVGYITATISSTPLKWPDPMTGFSTIRSFNQYQLWTLGLVTLPLLTLDFKNKYASRWFHFGLSFWMVLLFYSASRGALLAWFFGIFSTAIIYRKLAWPFIRIQIFHMISGFLIYKIFFQFVPSIKGSELVMRTMNRASTSDRIELWNLCLSLIKEHPFFGIGPMNYAWVSQTVAHPHNSVLQLMSEWGVAATVIIISLAAYGITSWLKKFNAHSLKVSPKLDSHLAIILFFTLSTSAAYSLVDGVIVMPISQVMMFTFIGLATGFYGENLSGKVKSTALFKPIFAGIVLFILVWSTLPEILQSAAGSEKHFSMNYIATGPRFWLEVK